MEVVLGCRKRVLKVLWVFFFRGSEEAVPVPSVFPSGDPGVSGAFLGSFPKFVGSPSDHSEQLGPCSLHDFAQAGPRGPERVCHIVQRARCRAAFLGAWGRGPSYCRDFVTGS